MPQAADLDDLVQHLKKQTERHEAAISHAKTTVSSQEAELTKLEQIASTHQNWPQSALKLWHPPLMYPTSLFTGGLRPCGKDVLGLVTSSTARSRVHAARHELDYVAKELSDRSASQSGFQQQVSILQQELQAQEAQLEADWGRPKLWWEWLEGPQDPLDWTSGLKSAAASAAGDFMGQFWDDDKCTLPIKLSSPTSKYWAEDGQAGFDLEQPGKKADQKAYTDWEQEKWLAEHTLRRSTQKGFPRAFTPRGLENATPRFEDRFAEDEPATLDPRLPRPASLPDLRKYPVSQQEAMWKDARMEAFDGNVDALGLKSMGADLMGIDMLDMMLA
eukprot:g1093.t1